MYKNLFIEEQKFRQKWLWILLIGILLFPLWTIFSETQFGSESHLNYFGWFFLAFMSVFLLFFYKLKLTTVITKEYISIRFNFFHRKEKIFNWHEVQQAEILKYNPILDYGGWGIKYGGLKSIAYNVSGNQGLQLLLKDGRKILIGTQKPDQIEKVIKQIIKPL